VKLLPIDQHDVWKKHSKYTSEFKMVYFKSVFICYTSICITHQILNLYSSAFATIPNV